MKLTEQGSGTEGVVDLCFHTYGEFFLLAIEIWAYRQGFGPQGWDLGLEARIWASRLGFGPVGWDLGL